MLCYRHKNLLKKRPGPDVKRGECCPPLLLRSFLLVPLLLVVWRACLTSGFFGKFFVGKSSCWATSEEMLFGRSEKQNDKHCYLNNFLSFSLISSFFFSFPVLYLQNRPVKNILLKKLKIKNKKKNCKTNLVSFFLSVSVLAPFSLFICSSKLPVFLGEIYVKKILNHVVFRGNNHFDSETDSKI